MRSKAPDLRNTAPTAVEPEIVENDVFWRPPPSLLSAFAGCTVGLFGEGGRPPHQRKKDRSVRKMHNSKNVLCGPGDPADKS